MQFVATPKEQGERWLHNEIELASKHGLSSKELQKVK
jgi:hypothetical protein